MKSQPQDSESIHPLSFGEILKFKEKQLQQDQEGNVVSAAVGMAAVQIPSLEIPLLGLSLGDGHENVDTPADRRSESTEPESSEIGPDLKMSLTDSQIHGVPGNAVAINPVSAPTETKGEDQVIPAQDVAPAQTRPAKPAISQSDPASLYPTKTAAPSMIPAAPFDVSPSQTVPTEAVPSSSRLLTNTETSATVTDSTLNPAAKTLRAETPPSDNATPPGWVARRIAPEAVAQPAARQSKNLAGGPQMSETSVMPMIDRPDSPTRVTKRAANVVLATESSGTEVFSATSTSSFTLSSDIPPTLESGNLAEPFIDNEGADKAEKAEHEAMNLVSQAAAKSREGRAPVAVETIAPTVKTSNSSSNVDVDIETSNTSAQPRPLSDSSSIRTSVVWTPVEAEALVDPNQSLDEVSASSGQDMVVAETQNAAGPQVVNDPGASQLDLNQEDIPVETKKSETQADGTVPVTEEPSIYQAVTENRQTPSSEIPISKTTIDVNTIDVEDSRSPDHPIPIQESRVVEEQARVSRPESVNVQAVSYAETSTDNPITSDDKQIPSEANHSSRLIDANPEDVTLETTRTDSQNNSFTRVVENPQPEAKESVSTEYPSEAYHSRATVEPESQPIVLENGMAVSQDRSVVNAESGQMSLGQEGIQVETEATAQVSKSMPAVPMASHPTESLAHSMADSTVQVSVETKETVLATEANSEMPTGPSIGTEVNDSARAINADLEDVTVGTKRAIAHEENSAQIAEAVELDINASLGSEDASETKNEPEIGEAKTPAFVSSEQTATHLNQSKMNPAFVQKENEPEIARIEMEAVDSQVSIPSTKTPPSTAASRTTAEMGRAKEEIEAVGEPVIQANTARVTATQSAFDIQHEPTAETQSRITAGLKNTESEIRVPTPVIDPSQVNFDLPVTQMTSLQESTDSEIRTVNVQPAAQTESPAINKSDLPKVISLQPATNGETPIVGVENDVNQVKATMKGSDAEKSNPTDERRLSVENQRQSTETLEPAVGIVNSPSEPLKASFEKGSTIQIDLQAADVVKQVIQHLNGRLKSGPTTMHLHLNPEEWGAIEVEMIRDSQGVSVTFFVEQASTGKLLETQLGQLRQSLVDSGVQLSGLNIGQHSQPRQEGGFPNQNMNFAHDAPPQREGFPGNDNPKESPRAERAIGQTSEINYLI